MISLTTLSAVRTTLSAPSALDTSLLSASQRFIGPPCHLCSSIVARAIEMVLEEVNVDIDEAKNKISAKGNIRRYNYNAVHRMYSFNLS